MNGTCPNCHTHDFELRPITGSRFLAFVEKVMVRVGFPLRWFKNIILRCTTCKSYWRI